MITLYGIPNCDTVRKARKWLSEQNIDYQFHNFKKDGLERSTLEQWLNTVDWSVLLNKRSTSWRQLSDNDKLDINQDKAISIMLDNLSIIKRPVLDMNNKLYIGFKELQYKDIFS